MTDIALDFDDVLLVPQYSTLKSRSEASTRTMIGALKLEVPIFSANMDTVTGYDMASAMDAAGAAGVLHRYVEPSGWGIPSIGVGDKELAKAGLWREYTEHICVDIAHGDSAHMEETLRVLKREGFKTIIAGNVATSQGALRLVDAGANVIKVGIGPGSVCTTRLVTGHGVPQLYAIQKVSEALRYHYDVTLIADGGMRNSGDIVKALAAGAHAVMSGSLFAGCDECPAAYTYRGMASAGAMLERGRIGPAPEGITVATKARGRVYDVVQELAAGIRSGMSYSGAYTLRELRENAKFIGVNRIK